MKKNFLCVIFIILSCFIFNNYYHVFAKETSSNVNLVITFDNKGINYGLKSLILKDGGQIIEQLPEINSIEVKCNSELIPKIQKYYGVTSIYPELKMKLPSENSIDLNQNTEISTNIDSDLYDKYQWDIKKVTYNGKSFKIESGNHNVVVGIIDTGVDTKHPDLKSNFLGGENFVTQNFEDDSTETGDRNDIEDRNGHGTHVAGTIAGNGRIKGVAPNIGFKSYRIFDKKGDTSATIAASAIIQATKDKVNVINLSFSGYDLKGKCYWKDPSDNKIYRLADDMSEYSIYKRAIKYAIKHGVVVVTSAGNDKLNCADKINVANYLNNEYSSEGFEYKGLGLEVPGTIKGVINVSATDINDNLASYSNYGDGFIDVAAPGGDSKNRSVANWYFDMCLSTYKNNSYKFEEGTSMAAPKVSAVAGLIICKYRDITPKEVTKRIYKSATYLQNDNFNEYFGHGLVNAYNALNN